ncbi:MAG: glycosyltransferase, partial [Actinobacteria bacterium]|nr:glycosyltransferase [Actinomycetota bacterium]
MEDFELIFDFRMSEWSGIGRYSTNLIKHLIRLKKPAQMKLLGTERDFEKIEEFEKDSNITRVILKEPVFSLSNFIGFGKKASLMRASNMKSVLHIPHFTVSLLDTQNLVVTIHDLMPLKYPIISSRKRAIYRMWNLIAARKAKRIITVSNFVKRDIVQMLGVKEEKIDVIHLAPDEFF